MHGLNEAAAAICGRMAERAHALHIASVCDESGARLIDCGVHVSGGLLAGLELARVCTAACAEVDLVPCDRAVGTGLGVQIYSDQPVAACLAAQYTGWQISGENNYFAMGSGPMRALRGREPMLEQLAFPETSPLAVGTLEAGSMPSANVARHIADQCGVDIEQLILLVAPTSSLAGHVQVVARSVETALHKLHELEFDVHRVRSGWGLAPLPPVAGDDISGIGRTNDAILYGAEVTLWVEAGGDELAELVPRIPSASSDAFGRTFAQLFHDAGNDFYALDPLLFSPAVVRLVSLIDGRTAVSGEVRLDLLAESFLN